MKNQLKLFKFAQKYRSWLILAFLCLLASTAFSLIVPDILRGVIDTVLNNGQQQYIIMAALAVFGASVLRGIFSYSNSYITESVSQRVAYDIRNSIYDHLQRLSFAYYDQAQTGQLMSRATEDVEATRMFIGRGLLGLIQTIILFVAISVILVLLNWQLALVSLAFLPAIAYRTILVARRLRKIWRNIQQQLGVLNTTLEENLTGVRVVKAFSHQPEESREFARQTGLLYEQERNADRQMSFNITLMTFLIGLPTALILWYGGRLVIAGNLTIGGLTQFIFYLGILAGPVRRLGWTTNMLSRSLSAGQRILDILDRESPVTEKQGAVELDCPRGEVVFDNVSFSFDSNIETLKNVSFSAGQGQLVAIVGSSGSGKSTIAHLIPRFYDVTAGAIKIDGTDIRDVTLASLRRNVGIVQQDIFLFSATIRDNIAYGASEADAAAIQNAARSANLHDFIMSLPQGYDTIVGERGITLSGGEKQRLALARTLLTNPGILILDDATSSVDAATEQVIRHTLQTVVKGRTTFIITHRLPVIRNADLILVLKDGAVVERGKHDDLIKLNGLYSQVYQAQMQTTAGFQPDSFEAKPCT